MEVGGDWYDCFALSDGATALIIGEDLDRGLARLRRHAAALTREPLAVFCDELFAGLAHGGNDDIALLAVRLPPHDLPPPAEERP